MYEALKELRKWQGPSGMSEEIDLALSKADAAIAKAEGK
jgi:hypothetical protein